MAMDTTDNTLDGQAVQVLPEGVAKELVLPSGKKATIFHGLGEHAQTAQEMATEDGKMDQKKYFNSLMHQLILIDGKKIFPEEFSKMPMKDYMTLQAEFSQINF